MVNAVYGRYRLKRFMRMLAILLVTSIAINTLFGAQQVVSAVTGAIYLTLQSILILIGNVPSLYLMLFAAGLWFSSDYICRPQRIRARKRLDYVRDIKALRAMSWQQFEAILADYYTVKGYHVEHHGGEGGDGGIDLFLKKDGKKIIIQAKHYRNQVGVAIVREMYGVLMHYKVDEVYICTTSYFTKEAKAFARGKPITLIHGHRLVELFNEKNDK